MLDRGADPERREVSRAHCASVCMLRELNDMREKTCPRLRITRASSLQVQQQSSGKGKAIRNSDLFPRPLPGCKVVSGWLRGWHLHMQKLGLRGGPCSCRAIRALLRRMDLGFNPPRCVCLALFFFFFSKALSPLSLNLFYVLFCNDNSLLCRKPVACGHWHRAVVTCCAGLYWQPPAAKSRRALEKF